MCKQLDSSGLNGIMYKHVTFKNNTKIVNDFTFLERIDPQARDPRVQGHCEWRSCSLQLLLL